MARPRTPADILEMRGAYAAHPERRRQDPDGASEFEKDPPTHLPKEVVPAWHYIVARIPKIAVSSSDEMVVEQAAKCLYGIWDIGINLTHRTREFKTLHDGLLKCLEKLGMTPVDRAKLASDGKKKAPNPFGKLKA